MFETKSGNFLSFFAVGYRFVTRHSVKSKRFHISTQFFKSDSMTRMHGNLPLTLSCMRPCVHCMANLHTVYGQLSQ